MSTQRVIAVVLACLPVLSQAAPLPTKENSARNEVIAVHKAVTNAFQRRMAVLDGDKNQASTTALGNLFPAYGFAPRVSDSTSWTLTSVNEASARLCIKLKVVNVSQWNSAIDGFRAKGMAPATADCAANGASFAMAPNTFPATIAGIHTLSREDVLVPTMLPSDPQIRDLSSKLRNPGITLYAQKNQMSPATTFQVYNTPTIVFVGTLPLPRMLSISGISTRAGFSASHNCNNVTSDGLCTISVQFNGTYPNNHVGSLKVTFSNGATMVVGLLGKRV